MNVVDGRPIRSTECDARRAWLQPISRIELRAASSTEMTPYRLMFVVVCIALTHHVHFSHHPGIVRRSCSVAFDADSILQHGHACSRFGE